MNTMIRVAGIQMEPVLLNREQNLARCLEQIKTAANKGVNLVVFPEATLSGYIFNSLDEARPIMEPVPGPSTERILEYCRKLNVYAVLGLLEEDQDMFFNTAVLLGPSGLIGKYRKLHLPYIGIDRFLNHGNLPLIVYDTDLGRIGLGICYDLDFPEHARVLTLRGAEIVILITNWPEGIEFIPEHTVLTRARENHIFCLAVNRVGEERGIKFFGRSKFADCLGTSIADGKPYEEDVLNADINPFLATEKHQRIIPGQLEIDLMNDRRPEFYGILTQTMDDTSRIR
jgi:5-aminopentanamidase